VKTATNTWVLGLTLALAGCGSTDVSLAGSVPADYRIEPLSFDARGRTWVGGQEVFLDTVWEDEHYGVAVASLDGLPPEWRPSYAREGGLLVTAVANASPLAIAGLRPYDVVRAVDGKRPTSPDAFVRELAERERVSVQIVRSAGTRAGLTLTLEAQATAALYTTRDFALPLFFRHHASTTGSAWALGGGLLLHARNALLLRAGSPDLRRIRERIRRDRRELAPLLHRRRRLLALRNAQGEDPQGGALEDTDEETRSSELAKVSLRIDALESELFGLYRRQANSARREGVRHVEHFEWGLCADLFQYRRQRDPRSGREVWQVTLLWIFDLGDDIPEAHGGA
jgi:hypothetical protein